MTSPRPQQGDPDPTMYFDDNGLCCSATHASRLPGLRYRCTLPPDHVGDWHVAGDGQIVLVVWPVRHRTASHP